MSEPPSGPQNATERLSLHLVANAALRRKHFGLEKPSTPAPAVKFPTTRASKPSSKPSPNSSLWTTMEKKQLELELQSLREAYARKIADTELQCEKKLEAAEADREAWFKVKKVEIAKIRAGVVVMQALFERRKRKFIRQMEEERAQTEKQRLEMNERVAEAEAKMVETTTFYENRLAETQAAHAKKLKDLELLQKETEDRAFRAEKLLKISEAENTRLQDVEKSLRFDIEDLRVRLQDSERAEELQRAKERSEFLEDELRKTRQKMMDRRHAEAESLRRELMDYVKFIVKILPEEWKVRIRPEILQRVASQHSASPEELEAYFENSGPSLQGDGSG
ncbi:unnamed protein product [Effrenium voratum]|uniref:Uncharacterized protein n=1 Tax=Effrenium voratum TaxID=2562239 RepID=A0AA36IGN9_9DINO|nr:unnamed protein product [Effrenium voratum]CAJ1453219.1 unnamed protein product [Effrenium voratum]